MQKEIVLLDRSLLTQEEEMFQPFRITIRQTMMILHSPYARFALVGERKIHTRNQPIMSM
jgi:hypothetical protein